MKFQKLFNKITRKGCTEQNDLNKPLFEHILCKISILGFYTQSYMQYVRQLTETQHQTCLSKQLNTNSIF